MARDDRRMHGGNTPGLVPGRGHERREEPVRLGEREPGTEPPDLTGDAAMPEETGSTTDRHQPSVLGGDVATRSGTAHTSEDEQA